MGPKACLRHPRHMESPQGPPPIRRNFPPLSVLIPCSHEMRVSHIRTNSVSLPVDIMLAVCYTVLRSYEEGQHVAHSWR
jgi:hypothetical protein